MTYYLVKRKRTNKENTRFPKGCRKDEIRRRTLEDSKCAREFFFLSLSLSRTVVIKNICAVVVVVVVVAVMVMS
jgi:hypothetical protein